MSLAIWPTVEFETANHISAEEWFRLIEATHFMSFEAWQQVTQLGAAGAILPMVPIIMLGYWQERRHQVVVAWSVALVAGILVVLISKIAFAGWGLGIASLDFTGVSGHALLATAILPVAIAWFSPTRHWTVVFMSVGLAIVILVGGSRVMLGAHSWSEVAAGWCLGALVSGTGLILMRGSGPYRRVPFAMRCFIAMALMGMIFMNRSMAEALPSHTWEVQLALVLSGHERPFQRCDLHRQAGG